MLPTPISSPHHIPSRNLSGQPWRPWSVPLDPLHTERKLCGLLNKVTKSNFDRISDAVVDWALTMERTEDMPSITRFASVMLTRGVSDRMRAKVYGELCQRIMDEVQSERVRCGKADPYLLDDPFRSAMQAAVQSESERILEEGDIQDLAALTHFITELLMHDVLDVEKAGDLFDMFFTETENGNEDYAVILYRSLSRLVHAPEIIDSLEIVERIERLLRQGSISLKVRYLMMAVLKRANDHEPQDSFESSHPRAEIYGIVSVGNVDNELRTRDPDDLQQMCDDAAKGFVLSKVLTSAEDVFGSLAAKDRHLFVASLVSVAVSSQAGDEADATLVASLFGLNSVQELCPVQDAFIPGFEGEISRLGTTVLDIPKAYRRVAIMMNSCGMSQSVVEDLVLRVARTRRGLIETLLSEFETVVTGHKRESYQGIP
ncbi:hypothetical protein SCP_0310240 [Sparassis crispa]|uniref:MIF4G domain-containing protein n=1 Tax=Sparassis crispa TaxID=139825 RepID=A0A401GGI5_9APHY|nr:hypothetical protein SCP_0310240 [Sparassis crispa]GBE81297.1 hypothetical protein SCP_0310240 [Sparassis crispa]